MRSISSRRTSSNSRCTCSSKVRRWYKSISTCALIVLAILLLEHNLYAPVRRAHVFSSSETKKFIDTALPSSKSDDSDSNDANNGSSKHDNELATPKLIDFIIAGFPKTGTTSLLALFGANDETSVSSEEFCWILNWSDNVNMNHYLRDHNYTENPLNNLSSASGVKRGIKCPMSIFRAKDLYRLQKVSPGIKILVGMRHPVELFQSFYNYRVMGHYQFGWRNRIPPPESLVGGKTWRGVSTEVAQYELSFLQYNKTSVNGEQLDQLEELGKSVKSLSSQIFIYHMEQLDDSDEERAKQFRSDIQQFLELNEPLDPVPKINVSAEKKKAMSVNHPNTNYINICDSEYDGLRELLLNRAKETEKWIREVFISSPDVVVGGSQHFLELMSRWGKDICHENE